MLYIFINLRTKPTHLTTYWVNIRGILNPTLISRVNKLMINNIRSTYNCHTFLESSGQVNHIGLISGDILTNVGSIWCYFNLQLNRVKKLIFILTSEKVIFWDMKPFFWHFLKICFIAPRKTENTYGRLQKKVIIITFGWRGGHLSLYFWV